MSPDLPKEPSLTKQALLRETCPPRLSAEPWHAIPESNLRALLRGSQKHKPWLEILNDTLWNLISGCLGGWSSRKDVRGFKALQPKWGPHTSSTSPTGAC